MASRSCSPVLQEGSICLTCGDKGEADLLIYCRKCCDYIVHHYCNIDEFSPDDDNIYWVCWDCASQHRESEASKISRHFEEPVIHPSSRPFSPNSESLSSDFSDNTMNKFFKFDPNTPAAEKTAFSPSERAVDAGLAAVFHQEEERRLAELTSKAPGSAETIIQPEGGAFDPIDLAEEIKEEAVEVKTSLRRKKRSSSSQKSSKKRKTEEDLKASSDIPGEVAVRGKNIIEDEGDDGKEELRLNLTRMAKVSKFLESLGEKAFRRGDQLKEVLEEKKTLESDVAISTGKAENLSARLEEREVELAVARSEVAKKEELLLAKEKFAMEKQSAYMAVEVENRKLKEELEKEKSTRAEFGKAMWDEGFYRFARSSEMELTAAEFRERLLFRLWNSVLFLSKAAPMDEAYFREGVRLCQEEVGQAFQFDVNSLGGKLQQTFPIPPDWHGDPNEDIDAQWWTGCLEEALKEVLPDKLLDNPSTSLAPPALEENSSSAVDLPEDMFDPLPPTSINASTSKSSPSPDHL